MYKFDREKLVNQYQSGLALRGRIEETIDALWEKGIRNICWLGIGGTWASCLQAVVHMQEKTALDVFAENAGEYLTTGNRRVGKGTLTVISSVSGTTREMVEAVQKMRDSGAFVLGFIDEPGTILCEMCDVCISDPKNEQLKFFMTADRLLMHEGVFPDYEEFYAEMDQHLAEDLAEVEFRADAAAQQFVKAHKDDGFTYFVGAGALYGAVYSYAMCYWEEMHWMRTKSIHAAEFFHGMLEIIDENTSVVVLQGEDSQRPLTERVIRFLDKVNHNHLVIDSANYEMPGISPKYRGSISHLIVHAVTNRIDMQLEEQTGHDMNLRRYYRKVEY